MKKKKVIHEFKYYELSIFWEVLREFKSQCSYIERFISKNNSLIEKDIVEFEDELNQKHKDLFNRQITNPSEQDMLLKLLDQDHFLKLYYRDLVRKTILLLIITKFENSFRDIATRAERESNSRIKLGDLSNVGSDTEKLRKYLDLTIGIDFSKLNSEWIFIMDLNFIRTLLIHFDGDVENFEKSKGKDNLENLLKRINKYKSLNIKQKRMFIISDDIILLAMNNYINFLRRITKQLEKLIQLKSQEITIIHYDNGTQEKTVKDIV